MRAVLIGFVLFALVCWASITVAYGIRTALASSADLERRAEEVALFRHQQDPYQDPDMTYPPTALPIFTALVPLESSRVRRVIPSQAARGVPLIRSIGRCLPDRSLGGDSSLKGRDVFVPRF